jgi:integrase
MKVKPVKKGHAEYLVASLGSCSVKIYSTSRRIGAATYQEHCLAFSEAGRRVRRRFSDLDDAKAEAERVLLAMTNGTTKALTLDNAQAEEYTLAVAELNAIGSRLLPAVREYRGAVEVLKGKAGLAEAVKFFMASGITEISRKTVPEVVTEFIAAKKQDGRSKVHLNDLGYRLALFAGKFSGQIADVTKNQITDWLRGLGLSPRGRNNYGAAVANLFRWARDEKNYLPAGRPTVGENLPRAAADGNAEDVVIFKPAEVRTILNRLAKERPELLPFAAIGAFAGLRTAELQRVEWAQVEFEQGHIEVKARNAKTRSRRLIPIQPNLAKWLAPYKGKTGFVAPFIRTQYLIQRQLQTAPADKSAPRIEWKRNALRHSFGTYRLAVLKNENLVAVEMGNSPAMLFANYRGIVTEAQAAEYFTIEPEAAPKAGSAKIVKFAS